MKEVISKYKGTGIGYDDGSYEFMPQGKGEPTYTKLGKMGDSHISRTQGNKQSVIAHVKVSADEADPLAALHEQLDKLAEKAWPDKPLTEKLRGRRLINDDEQMCTVDTKAGKLNYRLTIDLTTEADPRGKIITLLTNLTKCLYTNQALLLRVYQSHQSSSNK